MRKINRKKGSMSRWLLYIMMFLTAIPSARVSAQKIERELQKIEFETSYAVKEGADGFFIIEDANKKYGLVDSTGKEMIACQYDLMRFPEDPISYDYLLVKQGSNWGILDYSGKTLIEPVYDSIDVFQNGNKVAAAYNGNQTELFNDKGHKIGELKGEYKTLSDDLFRGSENVKSLKDTVILNYQEQSLYFTKKGTDVQVANVYALGDHILADYNVGSGNDKSKDEMYGKISTYRYIRIFDKNGKIVKDITPDPAWTKNEKEVIRGAIRTEKVISDHSVIVRLMGYKQDYLTIYNTKTDSYSDFYKNISDFYDGRAFAADESGELYIIDENGEKKADNKIEVADYERLGISTYKHEPFAIFKKKEDQTQYKLYSMHSNLQLQDTFSTVTFRRNENDEEICKGFPLVSNSAGEYTILDHNGTPFFEYGIYDKKTLVKNTLYALNCITIVTGKPGTYLVHAYYTGEGEKTSLFESPVLAMVLFGAILLLLILLCIAYFLKKKSDEKNQLFIENRKREMMEDKALKHRIMNPNPFDPPKEEQEEEEVKEEEQDTDSEQDALEKGDTIRLPDLRDSDYYKEEVEENNQNEEIELPAKEISNELLTKNEFYGKIICLKGAYIGAEIALHKDEWIRIGRDETQNDLVMPSTKVSRKHCAIKYSEENGKYIVIDYSRNGVYTTKGKRLAPSIESELPMGTRLYLGNQETMIELARERKR